LFAVYYNSLWADGFNHRLIFIAHSMAAFVAVGFNLQVYIHPTGGEAAAGLGMGSSGR